MAIRMRTGSMLVLAAVVAHGLTALGCGTEKSYPVVAVTPLAPQRAALTDTSKPPRVEQFHSGEYVAFGFDLATGGVLDITVDWTFTNSWIYVYFGKTACEYSQLEKRTCPFLISSETITPKPRVLYTEPLSAGRYYLVFYNVPWDVRTKTGTDNTETLIFNLGLTPTATAETPLDRLLVLGRPVVLQPGH